MSNSAPAAPAIEGEEMQKLADVIGSALVEIGPGMAMGCGVFEYVAKRVLASGPLAQLRSGLQAARDERDKARASFTRLADIEEDSADALVEEIELRSEAEANVIALAKMYGEACGRMMHVQRHLDACTEAADHSAILSYPVATSIRRLMKRAEAAESTASQLSARVRELEWLFSFDTVRDAAQQEAERLREETGGYGFPNWLAEEHHAEADRIEAALSSSETEKRDV